MLCRTIARCSVRRTQVLAGPLSKLPGFGGSEMQKPPENVRDTVEYFRKSFFTLPTKEEIIEAIGYPGQKGSKTTNQGCIMTLGRINYGPGRYDYGRPKTPKTWFANFFYGFWEFGHLMFVSERWITMRLFRHLCGIGLFFYPLYLTSVWHTKEQENKKAWIAAI